MKINHISVSRSQCWEECQVKYRYRYHLEMIPDVAEQFHFTYGKLVHTTAELYVEAKGKTPINKIASDIIAGKIPLEEGQEPKPIAMPAEYSGKIGAHLRAVENITKGLGFEGDLEWGFNYDLDPPKNKIFTGFIDRLIRKDDKCFIIDYKTSKDNKYRKDKESIKGDLQMQSYAFVARDVLKVETKKINLALCYLENPKVVPVVFDDKTIDKAKKYLLDTYNKIVECDENDAKPTVGYHCSRCDYREICPFAKK